MEINICGDSVLELVEKLVYARRILDKETDSLLISEDVASRIITEMNLLDEKKRLLKPKDLVGAVFYQLSLVILEGDYSERIEAFKQL